MKHRRLESRFTAAVIGLLATIGAVTVTQALFTGANYVLVTGIAAVVGILSYLLWGNGPDDDDVSSSQGNGNSPNDSAK
jgi:hypothetical protein